MTFDILCHLIFHVIAHQYSTPAYRQCLTGTRYPTRPDNFWQYPIRTRFFFRIIGYFGYRVFHLFLAGCACNRLGYILNGYRHIYIFMSVNIVLNHTTFVKSGLVISHHCSVLAGAARKPVAPCRGAVGGAEKPWVALSLVLPLLI